MQSVSLNPYSPGGAITDPQGYGFFGRDEIFQFVRTAIEAHRRTPILLYGQRRIGKSSILRQIPNHLSPDIRCVYYDLQGKAGLDLDQVLFGLAREISRELGISKPERDEAKEATFATEFLVRAIRTLDDRPDRLVLLFDEFDVLDERIAGEYVAGRRFINYLADLRNEHPQIGYIIVVGRKTDELSREFNSTLITNALQERIGRLDRTHSDQLVTQLAQNQDLLRFSQPALDRIYSLAAGHPYCTQLLCFTIWSQSVEKRKENIEVSVSMVEDAVLPSLEYGTLGLNWIFDGLVEPAYRLFLSALAEAGDPLFDKPARFASIEQALRKRQIALDQSEFSRAPEDLERWDIISRRQDGFHFQVPLIGVWIRKERPLQVLEREVRYSNPRAYAYYELAVAAHQAGDLDRAISDYQGALKENSVFFEAQRDLAIALSKRAGPEDVEAAIEAHERALDLDAEMPKSGLIQALLNALDVPNTNTQQLTAHYERIKELDKDGGMKLRAERQLRTRAFGTLSSERFEEAEGLFAALGEFELSQIARERRLTATILTVITVVIGLSAVIFRIGFSTSLRSEWKILLLSFAGASIGDLMTMVFASVSPPGARVIRDKPKQFFFKRSVTPTLLRLMFSIALSLGVGFVYLRFFGGEGVAQILSTVVGLYSIFVINTVRSTVRDDRIHGAD